MYTMEKRQNVNTTIMITMQPVSTGGSRLDQRKLRSTTRTPTIELEDHQPWVARFKELDVSELIADAR